MRQSRGGEMTWHITERFKSISCPQLDKGRRSVSVFGEWQRLWQGKFPPHLPGDLAWMS